jgi:hypothetical protein
MEFAQAAAELADAIARMLQKLRRLSPTNCKLFSHPRIGWERFSTKGGISRKGAKPPPGSHYSVKRDIIWRKPYAKRMLATSYDEVEKGIYKLKDGSLR